MFWLRRRSEVTSHIHLLMYSRRWCPSRTVHDQQGNASLQAGAGHPNLWNIPDHAKLILRVYNFGWEINVLMVWDHLPHDVCMYIDLRHLLDGQEAVSALLQRVRTHLGWCPMWSIRPRSTRDKPNLNWRIGSNRKSLRWLNTKSRSRMWE